MFYEFIVGCQSLRAFIGLTLSCWLEGFEAGLSYSWALLFLAVAPEMIFQDSLDDTQMFIYERKGPNIQTIFNYMQSKFSQITLATIFHLLVSEKAVEVLKKWM